MSEGGARGPLSPCTTPPSGCGKVSHQPELLAWELDLTARARAIAAGFKLAGPSHTDERIAVFGRFPRHISNTITEVSSTRLQ